MATSTAYKRGYHNGSVDARLRSPISASVVPNNFPIDKLKALFNKTTDRGATGPEVVASRRAAGMVLARWIKEQFNQDVDIQVT